MVAKTPTRWGTALAGCLALAGQGPAFAATPRTPWVGAWGYAASPAVETPAPSRPAGTFVYRIRPTQSGGGVALRFTNPENSAPLVIASVTVARIGTESPPVALDFGGRPGTTVAAGASISTRPGRLAVRAGEDILVTLVTSAPSTDVAGNAGFRAEFTPAGGTAETIRSRPFLSLVSVHNPQAPCTIVALGDSITEGARGTDGLWRGWPGRLAHRFAAEMPERHCGVVNMGISGNRLLTYGRGPAGIDRFGRDVLAVPGVTHVILLEGINDIARSVAPGERKLAAADLISGYRQVIAMAHARGVAVIGATMTPSWGSRLVPGDLERIRKETNAWIRTSGAFDEVIDFEAALSDGATPPALAADYDSGDKVHPGDKGFEQMAKAIPLAIFASDAPAGARSGNTSKP